MKIGVLALQGSYLEHIQMLKDIGVDYVPVKLPEDISDISGLIIPGGESTTIGTLMLKHGLLYPIKQKIENGMPVYGTCAGLVLLAKDIKNHEPPALGIMDITVIRNGFGRQVNSFEEDIAVNIPGETRKFRAVFIRAPIIKSVKQNVKVIAVLQTGEIVAAVQGNILVTAFHPELTQDQRVHRYFIEHICSKSLNKH